MKNTHKVRLPRPMGITQAMTEYHNTQDPTLLTKVQTFMIQQWLLSNGKLCGRSLDCNSLSKFIGCHPSMIQDHMRDQVLGNKIWDKGVQEEMMSSLMGQQIMWALEDRMEINQQVQILREAQGDRYMPFISAELNKALGLKLSSSNSLQSILKTMSGGGSINIFQQFNQQSNQEQEAITVETAITLIQEENSKLVSKDKDLQYIEATYGIEELPEVVATRQQGIDTSKEGLTLNNSELNQITDNYRGVLNEFEGEHHEIRREIELGIDPDSPDPEIDIYH
jgi:hypothetical protein